MKPLLLLACLALLLGMASTPAQCADEGSDRPTIIIYAYGAPDYAEALREIIDADERIDAEVDVTTSAEVLKAMIYFPNVKVAVVSLSVERDDGIGPGLEWFFSNGGGLVALGMTASDTSVGNASRTVFPIFGTGYKTGSMDVGTRKLTLTHLKEEDEKISTGVSNFTVMDHKVLLSLDSSRRFYEPILPETGEYNVLFRESKSGAPSLVKYKDRGVSVTFASFGGDDNEHGYSYFKGFTETAEFRTLFANAVYWVWQSESKYDRHRADAIQYYKDRAQHLGAIQEEAAELETKARDARNLGTLLTFGLAAIACVGIYWLTFARAQVP